MTCLDRDWEMQQCPVGVLTHRPTQILYFRRILRIFYFTYDYLIRLYFANIWYMSGFVPNNCPQLSVSVYSWPFFLTCMFCISFVLLEKMFTQWERFSSESEALSQWINEREKELEAVCFKSSSDPLDKHISTVEVCVSWISFCLVLFLIPLWIWENLSFYASCALY